MEVRGRRSSLVEGQRGFPTTLSGLALARTAPDFGLHVGFAGRIPGQLQPSAVPRTLFTVLAIWRPIEGKARGRQAAASDCLYDKPGRCHHYVGCRL